MKLYVVLVDDYRENWEPEVYLNGVFDSYDRAKEYVLEHCEAPPSLKASGF